MEIAIVEDNDTERTRLCQCLKQYSEEFNLPINLTLYKDGIEIIDKYLGNFDIIYFDVEMPIVNGMTAAKKIRQQDEEVVIVFITNYVRWAIDGYAVNASDFLLKPITYFNFKEHFKKIATKLANKTEKLIGIKTTIGLRKINLEQLIYIESEGHYLHFHTLDGTFSALDSMKNLTEKLKHDHFFRCNNCYLVNLKHVLGVKQNIVQLSTAELQISRPRKKEFLEALTNYLDGALV